MAFAQFRILFKKNFLLRRRQPVLFLFELLWPLILFSIVAIVRKTSPTQNRPACYYNPMPLPNSGTIGFLQSFLCNTNVSCRLKPFDVQTSSLKNFLPSVYDGILGLTETEGVNTVLYNLPNLTRSVDHINSAFNDTFLQKLLDGKFFMHDLFNNTNQFKNDLLLTGMPNDLIDYFLNGSFNLTEIYDTFNTTINLEPFCRNDFLNYFLTIDNSTNATIVIQTLCQLNVRNLTMDLSTFANELNHDTINKYFGNISELINGQDIRNKIQRLRDLEDTVKQLSSYANLLKNMPNMTEIARIIPRLIQIIELVQNQRDLIQLFGQILLDLHVLTEERIILQLYEITQMFVDFLQRYDNMTQSLIAQQLFNNLTLNILLQADLTLPKAFENEILNARINYLVLAEFLVAKITGASKYRPVCLEPGLWTIFILDDITSANLKDRVDRYCGLHNNVDNIYNKLINGIRLEQLQNYFTDMRFSLMAFEGLANILFSISKAGSFENDLRLTLESVSAVSDLLSRTKAAGVNLYASYNFIKKMTKTFNPDILKMPIFNTLDIVIPVLTPLFNFDQFISLISGAPRGTIDNIVNNINIINTFLSTPAPTKIMRLTTTANISGITTTKPRSKARYIDWSTLFQGNNFLNQNMPKSFLMPQNISEYTNWVKRQKRQLDLLSGLFGQTQSSSSLDSTLANIPDFLKMFNKFSPETLEFLCIEPLINLIPDDPVLNYIFGIGRLFELVNTFMTIITSTNSIHCLQDPNQDYAEISRFLRLNKTAGLIRELVKNGFQSKFSCSLVIDVVKNIQVYQNLVDIMQHNTITLDTLDCLKNSLLHTLERLKMLPGLFRFIFSDASLIRSIKQLTPLIEIFAPVFSQNTFKFVQINDMIEDSNNFTSYLQRRRNITSLNKWYFNTRLGHLDSPGDLKNIFCNRNEIEKFVIAFHDSYEVLEWNLCVPELLYIQAYQQFLDQYGRSVQLKKFNGLNIERLINEISNIRGDFELLSNENQWLMVLIDGINTEETSPKEIYKLFVNFTTHLPEFQRLKSNVSNLVEKYFWALPDESMQKMILSIVDGLELIHNLSIILQDSLNGLPLKDAFKNFSFITNKLMRDYGVSSSIIELLKHGRLFKDPIVLFNLYTEYHETVCDVNALNTTIFKSWPYLQFNSNMSVEKLSNYSCAMSFENQSKVVNTIVKHFLVPDKVQMFLNRGGKHIVNLFNMDEKEVDVFKQVGPIVSDVNELLKRVKRLNQQMDSSQNQDQFTKITNIFCAEIDKPTNAQRQMAEDGNIFEEFAGTFTKTNQNDSTRQQSSESLEDDIGIDCSEIRRSIEQSSDVGYIVWPLIKPLLLGKILYAPATPVSNAIIAKVNKTFEELDKIHQFAKAWVTSPLNLTALFGDLQNTNNIKKVLSNHLFQELFNNIIGMNTFDMESIISMLENFSGGTNVDVLKNIEIIMKQFSDYLPCIELNRFEALQSEAELIERAKELHRNRMVIAGIVFPNLNSSNPNANFLPPHLHVKIRMDVDSVRTTEQLASWLFFPGPENDYFREMHYLRGFIQLQDLVERAIIDLHFEDTGKNTSNPVVYMQLMPYPCYRGDPGKESSYVNYFILPILGTLMWTATLGVSIKNLMRERERNVEQTMKIMGLNSTINFISWLISSYIPMIFVSIIVAVVLKYGGIFPASELTVTITPLLTLALSALMLGYLVSAFFTKANLATLCGILIYFISYLPFILVMFLEAKMQLVHKILINLSSATAFGYASIYLTRLEYQGEGIQWNTVFKTIFPNDQMNFGVACVMMFVDSIIYGLIGNYILSVMPGKNGRKKPFWYPLLPSTWCFCKKSDRHDGFGSAFRIEREQQPNPFTTRMKQIDPNNELEPTNLTVGIAFENLSKQFGENKKAVENLSLKLYENQITALLGHNGAGKTTTISVLTGIYPPTNGSASIYGRDITTDYDQIRKNVGLCPQEDILFDFMTVREHLQFYGRLKGNMSSKELERDVNELLSSMGLWTFQHERVSSLSGGVRRRVAVSIAFVAGSRTVILDEPTSGVDPCARRSIWEVIFKHRTGRTILLTTHYLDEADTLSDRIAIIHQGRLLCSGSSMFLKKRFGKGYSLTVDLKLKVQNKIKVVESKQFKDLNTFILQEIPDATLREQIGSEVTYSLKHEQRQKFERLFKQIEVNKERLTIGNYGLSDTTLEEVFLWVTELADQGKMDDLNDNVTAARKTGEPTQISSSNSDDSGLGGESNATMDGISIISGSSTQLPASTANLTPEKYAKITGRKLYFSQFQTLLLKRFHHTKRNWKVFLSHILLPLIFVAMSMGFTLLRPSQTFQRPWLLTPAMYENSAMFVK
ncbi:unnamed protein product [Rotaria magnacalcarata]|uniref:ABC transporter domain-containing protein n=1 Tax=Rotaria magnacalcarata TaxID=392030 RepID=A0A815MIU1_9BILA|nr:unnamed protein product [Rotaria magnacalcarata]